MRIFLSTFAAIVVNSVLQSTAANAFQESSLANYKHASNLARKVKDLASDTNGRRLQGQDDFQLYCDVLESTGEFTCQCDETTQSASCLSNEICEDGICATVSFTTNFTPDFLSVESVEVCINFKNAPAGARDGCASFTVSLDGELETCEVSFDNDAGVLTDCNSCDICTVNGQEGVNLDCSNIEPEATTNGCEATSVDGDETTTAENLFPGFGGETNGSGSAAAGGPVFATLAILTATVVAGFGA